MRVALETALTDCADSRQKCEVQRFLAGLSGDELQYIAEFLGLCLMEPGGFPFRDRAQALETVARFRRLRGRDRSSEAFVRDQDHKTIVLMEFLRRAGWRGARFAMNAG